MSDPRRRLRARARDASEGYVREKRPAARLREEPGCDQDSAYLELFDDLGFRASRLSLRAAARLDRGRRLSD